jgi:hypothetical protein
MRWPGHLLRLLRAKRVYAEVGIGVDEVLEDDSGPRFVELRSEVLADL